MLKTYENCVGRTIPLDKQEIPSQEGEIVLEVYKKKQFKQISVKPGYLQQWEPVPTGEVIITNGVQRGKTGVVKDEANEASHWVVTLTGSDSTDTDITFREADLALLEAIKK